MTVVGRVAALWRYPVKSMAGEELDGVEVSWHGLAGDRRWAFVRDGQVRNGFPWMTIRERPEMAHYRPRFAEPDRPDRLVTAPSITMPFSVSGVPAIAIPCGFSQAEGMPLSLQIAAAPFDEATVLRVAHAYQQATDWHRRRPALGE